MKYNFSSDNRFRGIIPIEGKCLLSSPTLHSEEEIYIHEAFESGWITTVGENIDIIEQKIAEYLNIPQAVALSSGTAALHLAIKLAGERLYGTPKPGHGCLEGHKVFCSDVTFDATVNPVAYEGGEAVFIDTSYSDWNMNPEALEKAFEIYPDVKLVVIAHLYGTPGQMDKIKEICNKHNTLIVEDAAESLGAAYKGVQTGTFGDIGIISFNGNKIITGSSGGMLLTKSKEEADKARKWSTQSREAAPWYQHEEIGYNYRMSNLIAGCVRGQLPYLGEHISSKKRIYERYKDGLRDLPISMNPFDEKNSEPNYWLSCMIIDSDAMAPQVRGDSDYLWQHESGKSSPCEILEALSFFGAEGRPIWKPMHCQPIYRTNGFVTENGNGRGQSNAYITGTMTDVGSDIFDRGLCLPSDNKMTESQQDAVIEIIHRCFK